MRKFLALVFTIILVFPLVLSAQALISVGTFILDRQFYIDALDNDAAYDMLIKDTILTRFLQQGLSLPESADTVQLESVMETLLTREYFNSQVNYLVNDIFDYMQGRSENFSPTLDLSPIKSALSAEKQEEFLFALAVAMPDCEEGQIPGFGGGEQTACKPAGMADETLVKDYLKPVLPQALAQLPDQIQLVENWDKLKSQRTWRSFIPGMAVPASIMLSGLFFIFMATCFWYVAALIADESWRVRLQWLGWTLMIPSILILLAGLAASSNIPAYWTNFGLDRVNFRMLPFGSGLQEATRAVVRGAFPRVARVFMMVGGISGALSLGLIFWGMATPSKRNEK
ncbi:MAG TPA: hypothetical protein VMW28_04510 [Pelolinea sp.]|nr:hypothetical protein [Pelolinea sp.]